MKLDEAIAAALDAIPLGTVIEVEYEPATSTSRTTYRGAYAGRHTNAAGQIYFLVNAKGAGQVKINPRRGRIHNIKLVDPERNPMNADTSPSGSLDRILAMTDLRAGSSSPKSQDAQLPDPTPAEHAKALPEAQMAYLKAKQEGLTTAEAKRVAAIAYAESLMDQRASKAVEAVADAVQPGPPDAKPFEQPVTLTGQGGAPVVPLVPRPRPAQPAAPPPPPPPPAAAPIGAQSAAVVCPAGKTRAQRDRDAALAAGFALPPPVYALGTVVNQTGVDNARRSRIDHEQQPLVGDYCAAFVGRILAEKRRDVTRESRSVTMNREDGTLDVAYPGWTGLPISPEAFRSFTLRCGYKGADYLAACPFDLRAHNVNEQALLIGAREAKTLRAWEATPENDRGRKPEPQEVVFRLRNDADGKPEIFAVVSPGYTAFDVDKVAQAFAEAVPSEDANPPRGTVAYDGTRARFTAQFHSTVAPEHYVAGEVFRAGIHVSTDDTGRGGIRVRASIWQNRCRNLIILSESFLDLGVIRHVGSVQDLAKRFRALLAKAYGVLEPFRKEWAKACEEDVQETLRTVDGTLPISTTEAAAGVFRGLLATKQVKIPGRIEEIVADLVKLWEGDDSSAKMIHALSRAGVMNALTAYAHERLDFTALEVQDDLQAAAGELLVGRRGRPAPLPYVGAPS